MKYIKKQIPIEAVIFEGVENGKSRLSDLNLSDRPTISFSEIPTWLAAELGEKVNLFGESGHYYLSIKNLEGETYIKPGNYIIREANGELYGCDAKSFKETYEKVEG